MLEVQDLHVYYGEIHALKGVTLGVGKGEIVALLGNNGAGKTTTLKTLSGLLPARSGSVRLEGDTLLGVPPHAIVLRGIAHVPEGRRIFNRLTVLENLEMGAYARADAGIGLDLERVFALFPALQPMERRYGGSLSGGEQQMLTIARTLLGNPRLLLLDEPSEGLAPLIVREIGRILQALKGERLSVLLVEQNYHLALRVADRVYVMNKGQIVYEGTPASLEADEDVKRRYLGVA